MSKLAALLLPLLLTVLAPLSVGGNQPAPEAPVGSAVPAPSPREGDNAVAGMSAYFCAPWTVTFPPAYRWTKISNYSSSVGWMRAEFKLGPNSSVRGYMAIMPGQSRKVWHYGSITVSRMSGSACGTIL